LRGNYAAASGPVSSGVMPSMPSVPSAAIMSDGSNAVFKMSTTLYCPSAMRENSLGCLLSHLETRLVAAMLAHWISSHLGIVPVSAYGLI